MEGESKPPSDRMSDTTTITIRRDQREAIENAGEAIFGTEEVTVRATMDRLLADHPDVGYEPT